MRKELPDDELVLVILHIQEDRDSDELETASAKEKYYIAQLH